MAFFELGPNEGLYYEYDPPPAGALCFVFVNALTGSTANWQAEIGPVLREAGFGTLAYNFRGQAESPFRPERRLDEALIVADLCRLLEALAPPRPILVGLSIGGLFAARAWLEGAAAEALVLMNTLRRPGLRLDWINEAVARAAALGGAQLVMDLYLPHLVNPEKLAEMRPNCLKDEAYRPLDAASGPMKLLAEGSAADWDLPYEALSLPVLVMSGLRDRVFYDAEDVAALRARLPDAQEIVMPDAGHLIPMERGAATAEALLDFAERLDRPAR